MAASIPTPPPTAFPCTLPIINLGHCLHAFITLAKPIKNLFPSSLFFIDMSSSNEAPAQKVLSPPLFKIITFDFLSLPTDLIVSANFDNKEEGRELL